MKIAQSVVDMGSTRTYHQEDAAISKSAIMTKSSFMNALGDASAKEITKNQNAGTKGKDTLTISDGEEQIAGFDYSSFKPSVSKMQSGNKQTSLEDELENIRVQMLMRILGFLQSLGGHDSKLRDTIEKLSGMVTSSQFVAVNSYEAYHYESEYTNFQAQGKAVTEDGRIIDFGVTMQMSREFLQYTNATSLAEVEGYQLVDPLVINVSGDITSISDKTFTFDINSDGKADQISSLSKGSGFLAYDKNGDGIINNGSELFGAASGNGFEELSRYDEDGNGWIDENDSIYSKLSVYMHEDDKDYQLTLKEADVGAIYLGNVGTQFTSRGESMNVNGMYRSTGVYLRESIGQANVIQQVDLAVS